MLIKAGQGGLRATRNADKTRSCRLVVGYFQHADVFQYLRWCSWARGLNFTSSPAGAAEAAVNLDHRYMAAGAGALISLRCPVIHASTPLPALAA